MKNSLMVPAVFIVTFTVVFFILAFFIALALPGSTTILSSGYYQLFFVLMIQTGLRMIPVVSLIAIPGVFLFLMRHPSSPLLTIPLLVLVCVLAWCVFVPFSFFMYDRISGSNLLDPGLYPEFNRQTLLSQGVIRELEAGKRVIWLSATASQAAPVIIADTVSDAETPVLKVYPLLTYKPESAQLVSARGVVLNGVANPDPLFRSQLVLPAFLTDLVADVDHMLIQIRSAWDAGISRYFIEAGALALAVFGLWYFCICTGWRMLNLVLLSFGIRSLFYVYRFAEIKKTSTLLNRFIPESFPVNMLAPLVFAVFGSGLLLTVLLTAIFRSHGAAARMVSHD